MKIKKYLSNISAFLIILILVFAFSLSFLKEATYAQIGAPPPCTDIGCPDPAPDPGGQTQPTGNTQNPQPTGNTSNPVVVQTNLENPFKVGDTLFEVLKAVINDIILPIGGVLAVLAFIFSGFLYITAQGNEMKLKTAHRALLYSAIGTAVLLGAWVIAKVIEATINQLK